MDPAPIDQNAVAVAFQRLYTVIKKLRSPSGCPWDREQTPITMRPNLIEEVFECIDAIDEENDDHIKEELGDIFLLATMISYMKEEEGSFSVADVLTGISDKLIRRHPHVFKDASLATNPEEVIELWNAIKKNEKKHDSILDSVPTHFPPLEYAYKMQKKAAKVGFDFQHINDAIVKLREEIEECEEALKDNSRKHIDAEIGDLIFSALNVARLAGVDPSLALHAANKKFKKRFQHVEQRMSETGKNLESEHADMMNTYWDEAKENEQ